MRWNFSSRARQLSRGEAIIISIPKSGRTWLRAFLCAYYCKRDGLEMTLEPERLGQHGIPRIIYSHDRFEARTKGNFWDRMRGKYLVPPGELKRADIILLARDPRDAFVSLYVQMTRRTHETPAEYKGKTAGELLRDKAFGIISIINVMNGWLKEFSTRPNFTLARYEALRNDPAKHFRDILCVLGENPPQFEAYEHALAFSEFKNMKKLEAAGAFQSKILQPGDVADPESFKVRRGQVGGYRDDLSVEDQDYAAAAMRALNTRFGYAP